MNFGKLIKAFDALIALRDATRRITGGQPPSDTSLSPTTASGGLAGQIEARLTNVVVAALKEAFDRDHARLELERAQLDEERRRAEVALRLEIHRQVADRELGRLRLLAGTAVAGWMASVLVLGVRMQSALPAARLVLGLGWLLLLGSLAAAFAAQRRVTAYVPEHDKPLQDDAGGVAALWLLVAGLALSAMSLLIG